MAERPARAAFDGRSFVGRGHELDRLGRALEDAVDGRGQLVLLIGEPGIGKTRTAGEIAERARAAGAEVLVGRCYEDEGAPALWPWVQIARAFVDGRRDGDLAAALGPEAAELAQMVPEIRARVPDLPSPASDADANATRFRLFDAVTSCFGRAARARPIALVLDDLQGADPSSLMLLRFVARAMSHLPLLVVGTLRDAALTSGAPVAEVVAELLREPVTSRIALGGFSEVEIAEFIEATSGVTPSPALITRIRERTEGNPFFVGELVRLLMETGKLGDATSADAAASLMPPSVLATVGRRLARLSEGCVEMLRLASGFGREFRADAIAHAIRFGGERLATLLTEAIDARLIGEVPDRPGRYRFAHALTREALYQDVPAPRRAALHRRLAEALEAATSNDAEPPFSELAAQFLAADDPRGVRYARRAGDRAFDMLAHDEAMRQYEIALDTLRRAGPPDEDLACELLLALARVRNHTGDNAKAQEAALLAAESARRRGAREQLARAALVFSPRFLFGDGDAVDPAEVALLDEAIETYGDEDAVLHAQLLARLAPALFMDVDAVPRRRALSQRAVAMARRLGHQPTLAYTLRARHVAIWAPDTVEERMAIATELLHLGTATRDRDLIFHAHFWRYCAALERGDAGALDAEFHSCVRAAEPRDVLQSWHLLALRALRASIEGRWNDAFAGMPNLEVGDQSWWSHACLDLRSRLFWGMSRQLGHLEGFIAGYRANAAARGASIPMVRSVLACVLAEVGAQDARAEYDAIVPSELCRLPNDCNLLVALAHLADASRELGDTHGAAHLYQVLLPHAHLCVHLATATGFFGAVALYLGILATMLRRWPDAERHLQQALAVHERLRATPWVARTQLEYATMLHARGSPGDAERARAFIAAARSVAATLQMARISTRLDALASAIDESQCLAGPGDEPSDDDRAFARNGVNVFRRAGEYWDITFGGTSIRLRDTKGLDYIAYLLARPAQDVHVADLTTLGVATGNGHTAPAGSSEERDLGAVLDPRAVSEYRARLAEVREELEEATAAADTGRAARARHEIETITHALSAAFGLGGRSRRAGAPTERIRKAVTNQIRRTVDRIERRHQALGRHLANSLRTGVVCAYRPEHPIDWRI
jgi:tetratricopeptide (TPR) repeat protein